MDSIDDVSLFLLDLCKIVACLLAGGTIIYFAVLYLFAHTF